MHAANCTPENLCRAMGLGPFEPAPGDGELDALRVLLMPSFHPEMCLTFRHDAMQARLEVVAARSQIWRQQGIAPFPAPVDAAGGHVEATTLEELVRAWHVAIQPQPRDSVVICDGVHAHAVLRTREGVARLDAVLGERPAFDHLVRAALAAAWEIVAEPRVRNAIADLSGRDLPRSEVPPDKPLFTTMVLASDSEAALLLAALKRHHEQ